MADGAASRFRVLKSRITENRLHMLRRNTLYTVWRNAMAFGRHRVTPTVRDDGPCPSSRISSPRGIPESVASSRWLLMGGQFGRVA
jgi:hypothetical protein